MFREEIDILKSRELAECVLRNMREFFGMVFCYNLNVCE